MEVQNDLTGDVSVENKEMGDVQAKTVSIRQGGANDVKATAVDITMGSANSVEGDQIFGLV